MRDLFSLDGRVAFVTGGSLGLGNAMARGMAEYGAHVVINARNEERLNAKVEELRAEGSAPRPCPSMSPISMPVSPPSPRSSPSTAISMS